MTSPHAMPELVRHERRAFIDTLESLTPAQWEEPSLCSVWRVVDVAAHLAWAPVLGPVDGAVAMVRNRFSMNRMIATTAVGWSERGREAVLDQLRRNLASGAKPIGMPLVAALADAVVHGLDVRRPLGLPGEVPPEALAPLADFALGTPWPMNTVVGGNARRRIAGVRLVASDTGWTYGDGPEARGTAEALVLLLYGRPPRPDELVGPGAEVLAGRW